MFNANLPSWERWLRICAGVAMIGYVLWASPVGWQRLAIGGGGIVAILTGTVAFCPVCALAGRGRGAVSKRRPE